MKDHEVLFLGMFLGMFLGFVIGFIVSGILTQSKWQGDIVQKGFAEYHQTTGEWQWKEVEK